MNSFGRRFAAAITITGMATVCSVALSVTPAHAAPPQSGACDNAFWMPPAGSLSMTTDPAAGTAVLSGETIQIDATWDTGDWLAVSPTGSPMGLYQEIACASLNGTVINAIGDQNLDPPNDGAFSTSITVPQAAVPGDEFCVRVRISGHPPAGSPQTQKSETACFTVADALQNVDPETDQEEEQQEPEVEGAQNQQSPPLVEPSSEVGSTADPVVVDPAVEAATPEAAPLELAELPRTGTAPLAMATSGLGLILAGGTARFFGRHGRRR